jgi:SAM-dependent methyltransferase
MTTQRERRGVFGEAVDDYDAYRPGYPEQLVDDVIAAAGPGPALEIGAGTGKASAAFAARGLDLTCLEPDPRMAAMLRRNLPDVPIVTEQFETWTPDRQYGLLYSAQAWHWIDPERRTELAYNALAPGGLVALFWNVFMLADRSLHEALTEVDGRYIPAAEPVGHSWFIGDRPREIKVFAEEWPELALHDNPGFTDLRTRRYERSLTYAATDYAKYLGTTSIYRMLDPDARESVLTEITDVINAHRGTITLVVDTDLALARRLPAA